jgi:hypothetical protein
MPPFYLKGKEIELPKIKNAGALVEEEMNKRDLEFGDKDSMRGSHYPPDGEPAMLNGQIKG